MKRMLSLAALAALSLSLSGCFPLIAGGAVGGALVASDRRPAGTYVNDQTIEAKALSQLSGHYPAAHVNVNSYNQAVLLTGEVPDEATRRQIALTIRALPGVRRLYDQTDIMPASSLGDRSNDTWITSKVRARLLDGKGYAPQAVKVVTERGVVYLLGLVTRPESEAIIDVVRQTAGVRKVVPVFEYLNAVPEAK